MTKRIKTIENRIENRRKKIEKYQDSIKQEKEGLKKDEQTLIHLKYNDVLQRMIENDIDAELINQVIDENINTEETKEPENVNNSINEQKYK